jgi:hypothetical protein
MAARTSSLGPWRRRAIRQIAAARKETLALVTGLPDREILRPRTLDRWSVKDVLGHLLSCDEETVRRLKLIERGRGDKIFWFSSLAVADRFNARTVGRTRRLSLATILRRMARVRADLVARLERLPLSAYRDPSHAWAMVDWLPTSGWNHEREHAHEIKSWWRSRPK